MREMGQNPPPACAVLQPMVASGQGGGDEVALLDICETTGIPVESLTFVESGGTFQEADALVKDFLNRRPKSIVDAIVHRMYGQGLATILLRLFELPETVTVSGVKAALLRLRQEMLYAALSAPRGQAGGRVG